MRIISKFHDYYDVGMKYGVDNAVVYNREEREILSHEFDFIFKRTKIDNFRAGLWVNSYPDMCYILFCGKIYPFISFLRYNIYLKKFDSIYKPLYSLTAYEDFLNSKYENDDSSYRYWSKYDHENLKELYNIKPSKYLITMFTRKAMEMFYDIRSKKIDEKIVEINIKFNSPILFISRRKTTDIYGIVNPRLADYQFMKVIDPISAYQELQMFMSNFMFKEKEIIQLNDTMRLEKHGFDKRSSFRKMDLLL